MKILIGIVIIWVLCFAVAFPYVTKENVHILVEKTERITTGSGETISSKYLVFTDGEVFENTDSLLYLKFDSSNLQGKLKEGEEYDVLVYGWRVPFLSMYRNIVKVNHQPQGEE